MGEIFRTERDGRISELCSFHKIGDESHYILECTYFDDARNDYLPRNLISRPNVNVFHNIMNSSDTQIVFKVAEYCKIILKTVHEIFRKI